MRLTEVQVRQAFQHSDKDVRFAALQYFAKSFSPNPEIMQDVITVIEQFGPKEAFAYSFPISALVQTEETIAWAIQRLQHRPFTEADKDFAAHLGQLLLNADPKLIVPHQTEIVSLPGVDRKLASRLERRLEFSSLPGEQLWQRLNVICEAGKDKNYPTDIPYAEAEEIAKALGRDVTHADRMMDLLRQESDPESETPMTWLEIFMARMAGEMRYEPAVPLLVNKLMCDGEILSEECDSALTKIGTDSVIRAVREAYPQAPNYFRLYSSGLFGDIHSDLALSAGLELLSLELDPDQRTWLASALVDQFSTEAVDAARTVVLEEAQDFCDLKFSLVVACKLMAYEVPELKQWERDLAEPRRRFAGRDVPSLDFDEFDELDELDDLDDESEPSTTSTRIGRNDPCPCGSGKKYKKCCLNKPQMPR